MVQFNPTEQKVLLASLILILSINLLCLAAALHNIIRHLCKPRKNRLLINTFYFFIVTALLVKSTQTIYLMAENSSVFLQSKNNSLELLLYADFTLENCLCVTFVLMLHQLSLAIRQMFGSIDEKQTRCRRRTGYVATITFILVTLPIEVLLPESTFFLQATTFALIQLAFFSLICILHSALARLHQASFASEIKSIRTQNWIFFLSSVLGMAFLVLIRIESTTEEPNLITALLVISCFKFAIPVLVFMVAHNRIFKKVDTLA